MASSPFQTVINFHSCFWMESRPNIVRFARRAGIAAARVVKSRMQHGYRYQSDGANSAEDAEQA